MNYKKVRFKFTIYHKIGYTKIQKKGGKQSMKKWQTILLGTGLVIISGIASASNVQAAESIYRVSMYRLYNINTGEHFYTSSLTEKDALVTVGWSYEGIGWTAPSTGAPVYRLFNPNSDDHHYTMSGSETDFLVSIGWTNEGIAWYSSTEATNQVPLYRLFNPNEKTATHHYTLNLNEKSNLQALGWKDEGIGWYGINPNTVEDTTLQDYKNQALEKLLTLNLKERLLSFQNRVREATTKLGVDNVMAAAQFASDMNDGLVQY